MIRGENKTPFDNRAIQRMGYGYYFNLLHPLALVGIRPEDEFYFLERHD